jgi:hypothetical protein
MAYVQTQYEREKYCGPISIIVGIFCCPPCSFAVAFCPLDERDVAVNQTMVQTIPGGGLQRTPVVQGGVNPVGYPSYQQAPMQQTMQQQQGYPAPQQQQQQQQQQFMPPQDPNLPPPAYNNNQMQQPIATAVAMNMPMATATASAPGMDEKPQYH